MSLEEEKISIAKLDTICKLLDSADDTSEFLLNCTLNGISEMTDKSFYDRLYAFMFEEVTDMKLLKYLVRLKKNLPKLTKIFNECESNIKLFD